MNVENFAEWLRQQGHKVVRTSTSYWYDAAFRVYQAFPYHWLIAPSEHEIRELALSQRAIGLRYSTPLESALGRISYHAVYEGNDYNIERLGKWARKNVRRGLKNCSVEPVPFERIAEEGWELQLSTLKRQLRRVNLAHEQWKRRILAARDLPGFEAWGALIEGKLAASVLTFRMDEVFYLLYQQCHADYLSAHVNNALSFAVNETMLSRAGVRGGFYCVESLNAPESMDEFKFRMGYRAKPVRQRVVFNPLLSPAINTATHRVLKSLQRRFPENDNLSKAEGLVRFFLEGKKPIERQARPAALLDLVQPATGGQSSIDSDTDKVANQAAASL